MAVTRKKNLTMIMNNEKRQWRWKRTRTSEQMMKNFWEDDGQFIDGEEEQTSSGFVNEKQKKMTTITIEVVLIFVSVYS